MVTKCQAMPVLNSYHWVCFLLQWSYVHEGQEAHEKCTTFIDTRTITESLRDAGLL